MNLGWWFCAALPMLCCGCTWSSPDKHPDVVTTPDWGLIQSFSAEKSIHGLQRLLDGGNLLSFELTPEHVWGVN